MEKKDFTNIGLERKTSLEVAKKLNDLLANYQLYYMNLRGFHWNITGRNFFELHLKFEELYDDALIKVDEIAERVLTLDETPVHSYAKYLEISEIETAQEVFKGDEAIDHVLDNLRVLLEKERVILQLAAEANDEGSVSLMSDYIVQQEKLVWMFSAYKN